MVTHVTRDTDHSTVVVYVLIWFIPETIEKIDRNRLKRRATAGLSEALDVVVQLTDGEPPLRRMQMAFRMLVRDQQAHGRQGLAAAEAATVASAPSARCRPDRTVVPTAAIGCRMAGVIAQAEPLARARAEPRLPEELGLHDAVPHGEKILSHLVRDLEGLVVVGLEAAHLALLLVAEGAAARSIVRVLLNPEGVGP